MVAKNYGLVTSIAELAEYCEKLIAEQKPIGYDLETGYHGPPVKKGSVRIETNLIAGFSFTNSQQWARYAPLNHDMADNLDNLEAAKLLWPLMNSGLIVAHNAGFELRNMARFFREQLSDDPIFGEAVRKTKGYFKVLSDTWIESFLIGMEKAHGLKALVESLFGHKMIKIEELFDLPANKMNTLRFNELELEPKVVDYACEDALWCLAVHEHYYPMLADKFLYKVDMELMYVLCDMEEFGIKFDWELFRRTREQAEAYIEKINQEIQEDLSEMVGEPVSINLGSSPQLSDVLYNKLGMSTTRMTKGSKDSGIKKMSTDAIALEALSRQYPVVKKIHEWKGLKKLLTSYLIKYEKEYGYAPDGMVHPGLNQAFVVTGRFSASDPNYQQAPKDGIEEFINEDGVLNRKNGEKTGKTYSHWYELRTGESFKFNFRDAIIAPDDYYILGFDLSQAELRAIAGEAGERALLDAFESGVDVHSATAALMLRKDISEVTKEDRAIGKTAQPLDSKILTPSGWKFMRDLQAGDQVIGSSGKSVKIKAIIPKGIQKVYRVTTTDGATAESCGDHLWTVRNMNTKSRAWTTQPLNDLMRKGIHGKRGQLRYELPARAVVDYEMSPELPLDPYVLGLLLGDGGFTHSWAATYGSADPELLEAVTSEHIRLGGRVGKREETSLGFEVIYLSSGEKYSPNQTTAILRGLGLWGKRGEVKFVPEAYMKASPADRLSILQGLLDTDGTVQSSGAMFRVTSEQLALDVQELARSLGGSASIRKFKPTPTGFGVAGRQLPQWRVYLRLPKELEPFRLSRKITSRAPVVKGFRVGIKSIEFSRETEVQCISVEAEDGLYVTDDFITTHNCNFALLYGMGAKSLADRLAISVMEAEELFELYFSAYPNIKVWVDRQIEFGRNNHYVLTKFGRRCPIWAYESDKHWIRSGGDRNAFNYPIQGAATGDYPRIAMVRVHKAIAAAGLADKIKLVMNVHDALEFYVHRSVDLKTAINIIRPAVVFPVDGWPDMVADWHIGQKWGSVKDITLKDDGSIWIKKGEMLAPADSEEISIAPVEVKPVEIDSVQPEVFQDEHTPVSLVVELTELPETDSYKRFIDLLKANQGSNKIVLKTPEGDVELPITTSLGTESQARISLALGGARVYCPVEDIDPSDIFAGMVL